MLGVPLSRKLILFCGLLLGIYAAVSIAAGPDRPVVVFADVILCLIPLAANFGLLANAGSAYRRRNTFWVFWAIACALWATGQLIWAIDEFASNRPVPNSGLADALFFLSVVPMLAAAAARPHRRRLRNALRYGYVDTALLVGWWLYLYQFFVVPAEYVAPNRPMYLRHYFELTAVENLALLFVLYLAWRTARGSWRPVYFHLFGSASLHVVAWLLIRSAIDRGSYFTGSLLDLPLIASFLWLGLAGLGAPRLALDPGESPARPLDHRWALRLAVAGILSTPLFGGWALVESPGGNVQEYRIDLTLATIVVGILLLLLRQRSVDREHRSLFRSGTQSLDKMNRLQTQLVLSEKLASLGELAAGAAHEINNPLTAIFGYADLLLSEPQVSERVHEVTRKIQVQAQRTRALVDSLLSFARQVSAEKALLDMNSLLSSSVQLRRFQLAGRNVTVELDTQPGLPAVRGDSKLLLQVFYEMITNAADAMQPNGGRLVVRTRLERASVVVEFSDTGPGIERPELVFDPFYTTKSVGKGTGLGLSMCYGIVNEHGGQITCRNRPEGGALFRIELPAVVLPLSLKLLLDPASKPS